LQRVRLFGKGQRILLLELGRDPGQVVQRRRIVGPDRGDLLVLRLGLRILALGEREVAEVEAERRVLRKILLPTGGELVGLGRALRPSPGCWAMRRRRFARPSALPSGPGASCTGRSARYAAPPRSDWP